MMLEPEDRVPGLAPETRENEPTMRNSGLSLLVIWLGQGLRYSGMMVSVVSMVFSLLMMLVSACELNL
ncbi:hypothetical protein BS47DRAFT_178213 [Hydnum rufescens UP504]|uniref:Uncharacterized protein n=1 Tax=Hydnum rufescens UP504 TaxID=1448309 RepID=A0A9P6DS56_9AGAM|nr:hypothetical protein BS47DRAFT_178213 [Hydnum rufescens UP504]